MKLTGVNLSFLNLSTPFKSFTVPKYTKLVIPEPTAESSSNPELYVSLIFDFSVISWRGSLQKSSSCMSAPFVFIITNFIYSKRKAAAILSFVSLFNALKSGLIACKKE